MGSHDKVTFNVSSNKIALLTTLFLLKKKHNKKCLIIINRQFNANTKF